jgi:hypothetical protein
MRSEPDLPDIFDEVSEDLRAEKAQQFLKKYAWALVGFAVLVVAASGGWQVWRHYRHEQDDAASEAFLAAMREAQPAGAAATDANQHAALSAFNALAQSSPQGYRILATLRAAALKAQTNDLPGALALWDRVAQDDGADPLLRELANLLWAQHEIDNGDPAAVRARLAALDKPGEPFRALAEEAGALLDLRLGQTDAARAKLKKLAEDTNAPEGLAARAKGLLDRIGG